MALGAEILGAQHRGWAQKMELKGGAKQVRVWVGRENERLEIGIEFDLCTGLMDMRYYTRAITHMPIP